MILYARTQTIIRVVDSLNNHVSHTLLNRLLLYICTQLVFINYLELKVTRYGNVVYPRRNIVNIIVAKNKQVNIFKTLFTFEFGYDTAFVTCCFSSAEIDKSNDHKTKKVFEIARVRG